MLGLRRVEIIVGRLFAGEVGVPRRPAARAIVEHPLDRARQHARGRAAGAIAAVAGIALVIGRSVLDRPAAVAALRDLDHADPDRRQIGRAHAELQSLMRISYAVFCLKTKNTSLSTSMRTMM